jgi:protease-4
LAWSTYAAKAAKLGDGDWHPKYLGEDSNAFSNLLVQLLSGDGKDSGSAATSIAGAGIGGIVAAQQAALAARLVHDVGLLSGQAGIQAYCLECPAGGAVAPDRGEAGMLASLIKLAGFGARAAP